MKLLYFLLLAPAGAALAQTPATFAVSTYPAGTGSYPLGIAVADVNGDGRLDLVTANNNSSTAGVLLGQAGGGFVPVTTYSTSFKSSPYDIAVADVNGDGQPDLLTANYGNYSAGVLLGQVGGGFAPISTYLAAIVPYYAYHGGDPSGITVADVNGDGRLDLVTANTSSSAAGVLLGQANGGFAAVSTYSTGGSYPQNIVVVDVNGDGRLDLVTANYGSNTAGVLLGLASGGFGAATTYSTGANSQPSRIAVADVNGDGRPDLLTANSGSNTAGVLLGLASGGFGAATTYSTGTNSNPTGIAVADVDGDGRLDLVTTNYGTHTVGVLLGQTGGGFGAVTTYSTGAGNFFYAIAVADMNGDGRPDLVTANSNSNTVSVLLNTTLLPTRAALPGASATLYPNPAHASATLSATGLPAAARTIEATLLSPVGQVVRRQALPAALGTATTSLPTAGLAPGLYLLRLEAVDAQGAALGALPMQRLSVE